MGVSIQPNCCGFKVWRGNEKLLFRSTGDTAGLDPEADTRTNLGFDVNGGNYPSPLNARADMLHGHIYWTAGRTLSGSPLVFGSAIARADLDNSLDSRTTILAPSIESNHVASYVLHDISPTRGKMVYEKRQDWDSVLGIDFEDADLSQKLYIANLDGTGETLLFDTLYDEDFPSFDTWSLGPGSTFAAYSPMINAAGSTVVFFARRFGERPPLGATFVQEPYGLAMIEVPMAGGGGYAILKQFPTPFAYEAPLGNHVHSWAKGVIDYDRGKYYNAHDVGLFSPLQTAEHIFSYNWDGTGQAVLFTPPETPTERWWLLDMNLDHHAGVLYSWWKDKPGATVGFRGGMWRTRLSDGVSEQVIDASQFSKVSGFGQGPLHLMEEWMEPDGFATD